MPVKDENSVNLRTNVYKLFHIEVFSKLKVAFVILKDSLKGHTTPIKTISER